jgi:hypothetical protein
VPENRKTSRCGRGPRSHNILRQPCSVRRRKPSGNLTSRADNTQSFSESFTYDSLNRLSTYAVSGSYTTVSVAYNKGGNVTSRTDLGTFVYGEGNDGPQAWEWCLALRAHGRTVRRSVARRGPNRY